MLEEKQNWIFIRLQNPDQFAEFRWKDVGRPKHLVLLMGRYVGTKSWDVQSLRLEKRLGKITVNNNLVVYDKLDADTIRGFLKHKKGPKHKVIYRRK